MEGPQASGRDKKWPAHIKLFIPSYHTVFFSPVENMQVVTATSIWGKLLNQKS